MAQPQSGVPRPPGPDGASERQASDQPQLMGLAYLGFVILGVSAGLLGVAWPSVRATFNVGLDALGVVLAATTCGYILSSLNSGRIISLVGLGPTLVVSSIVAGLGLLGFALAPVWGALILAAVVAGAGAASIDAGLNTYVAVCADARAVNWLHASFGLGVALGPAIMTVILSSGRSWRYGYGLGCLLLLLLAAVYRLTLPQWQAVRCGTTASRGGTIARVRSLETFYLPAIGLALLLAFSYAGTEKTAGQWSYALFTEARAVPVGVAGVWMTIFWSSFTVGRLLTGFLVESVTVARLLHLSMVGMIGGSLLIAVRLDAPVSVSGLAVLGISLAPVYPLFVATTPRRVGVAHAPNAIGFQMSAAALGAAIVPGLVGVLAESVGLEVIGLVLVAACIAVSVLCEKVIVSKTGG